MDKEQRRSTKQRQLIFKVVQSLKSHPTAEDIYEIVKLSLPSISLGTVYRNLNLLASEHKIREIQFEPGKARFDGVTEDHEHFICNTCNRIIDIQRTPTIKYLASTNPEVRELTIKSYSLTYYGICKECESR